MLNRLAKPLFWSAVDWRSGSDQVECGLCCVSPRLRMAPRELERLLGLSLRLQTRVLWLGSCKAGPRMARAPSKVPISGQTSAALNKKSPVQSGGQSKDGASWRKHTMKIG